MQDDIDDQYADDQRWKAIITYASALAIFICCIGLIGLVHFEVVRRTREMSVRKVLGSSAINISLLLSRGFFRLILLSIFIASPIAWYAMNRWLNNFSYRIEPSWVDFAVSAAFVLTIALITVNIRAFRVATDNPVKYLRTD